jgi:predicted signal transduction protein with EAL and GGDEF domain
MANADLAMYRVKERGRNGVISFDAEIAAAARDKLERVRDLKRAIDRQEFVVYYQPQKDLWTGRWSGVEALVRWQHPTRGLVAPGDFIPLAEKTGLIALSASLCW